MLTLESCGKRRAKRKMSRAAEQGSKAFYCYKMKKLLGIVVLVCCGSILVLRVKSLSCLYQTGSIVLSFDKTKNIGKE